MSKTLRYYQREAIDAIFAAEDAGTKKQLLVLPTGCHSSGTKVWVYPNEVKPIEKITKDDYLVGMSGEPLQVLAKCRGRGKMYKVYSTTGKFKAFTCNEGHILTLLYINGEIKTVDIPLKEMLKKSPSYYRIIKRGGLGDEANLHYYKFKIKELKEDDYFGVVLDGDKRYCLEGGVVTHNSGKTYTFANIIKERPGRKALILSNRRELVSQTRRAIVENVTDGRSLGVIQAPIYNYNADIVIASIASVSRAARLARLPKDYDYVIVDECHHTSAAGYQRVISHLYNGGNPTLIGVTATPYRTDGEDLLDIYDDIVYRKELIDMIDEGFLSPVRAQKLTLQNAVFLNTDFSNGDFRPERIGSILDAANWSRHVVDIYCREATDRRTLIFVPKVEMAEHLAEELKIHCSVNAVAVHGGMSAMQRAAAIKGFEEGRIQALVSVDIFLEGTDIPCIDCIIFVRNTASLGLYMQAIGRGLRPYPGKEYLKLIDVVGVSERHKIMSIDEMIGCVPRPGEDIREAVKRKADELKLQQEAIKADIFADHRMQDVELFSRPTVGQINWKWSVDKASQKSCLSVRGENICIGKAGERYIVSGIEKLYPAFARDFGSYVMARKYCEQYAYKLIIGGPKAEWRNGKPTQRQIATLTKLKIKISPNLTAGQASDIIDKVFSKKKA